MIGEAPGEAVIVVSAGLTPKDGDEVSSLF